VDNPAFSPEQMQVDGPKGAGATQPDATHEPER
jgi:hypothetical protein